MDMRVYYVLFVVKDIINCLIVVVNVLNYFGLFCK